MQEPNRKFILALDEGTTNAKAFLVDDMGSIVKEASRNVPITYPQPAWVEQDAWEIWQMTLAVAAQVMEGLDSRQVVAMAITNQRESIVAWDRSTGKPLGPCITWQCHRTAPFCEQLRQQGLTKMIYQYTGLTIDPMFSASKARWLLEYIPNGWSRAKQGEICLGTVDSWLLWNLTGGTVHACDVTNASRTQLFNLHTLAWDDELLEVFGIPRATLPEVKLSSAYYGETVKLPGIPAHLPIASMIGDSQAALFGHAGFQPGTIKATYGTGSSLMISTTAPVASKLGLSTSIAWGYQQAVYALEGNIYITGAGVQWLQDFLGLATPDEVEMLAGQVLDNGGVYFVPALVGLGAPYWDAEARGLFYGLTRGVKASHAARAAIEAIAYQIYDVFMAIQSEVRQPLRVLMADGGATRNEFLMQFQADILGVPVICSRVSDLSALGAAYLGGLTMEVWKSLDEVAGLPRPHDLFKPKMANSQRTALLAGWKDALGRCLIKKF